MARVPLPDVDEFLEDLPGLSPSIDLARLNVIRAQGNNPGLLAAVVEYVAALYELLPADVRELVILSVAHETGSIYEWQQHVPVARDVGVADATIRAVGTDDGTVLAERDGAVVEFVRAQCRGDVTDDHHAALAGHFSAAEIVAISRLAGNYAGTADFVAAMDVRLEDEFIGWTIDG